MLQEGGFVAIDIVAEAHKLDPRARRVAVVYQG